MKVFISSPVNGFEEIRLACKEELDHLALDYFISEYEGSYTLDSLHTCLGEVGKCDIYVLLLVNKYGYIIPGKDISFTELEFDEARKLKKPILVYKLDYFDHEDRQKSFINKVENSSEGLFRGSSISNKHQLKNRLAKDIINYLAFKQDLNPIESISTLKENFKRKILSTILEQLYLSTGKKFNYKSFYNDIYVQRDIEEWINRFLFQQEKSTCAIVGKAGTGKSTLISKIAVDLLNKNRLILYYNVKYLDLNQDLISKLCGDLNYMGYGDDESGARKVNVLLRDSSEKLVVIYDGINELDDLHNVEFFKKSLANMSAYSDPKFTKIITTCRDLEWPKYINNNPRLIENLYIEESVGDENLLALRLRNFNKHERDQSFTNYKNAFNLRGTFSPKVSSICANPWMLRMLSEVYQGQELPEDIRAIELFQNYYDKKISSIINWEFSGIIINCLVKYILATGVESVPVSYVIEESGISVDKAIYQIKQLLSLDIMAYGNDNKVDIDFISSTLRFTYDKFMEFLLAKYILGVWTASLEFDGSFTEKSENIITLKNVKIVMGNDFNSWFKILYKTVEQFRFGIGVIEFLLLSLRNNNIRLEGLDTLINTENVIWHLTALSICSKTGNNDVAKSITERILLSNKWEIRLQLATAVAENFDELSEPLAVITIFKLLYDRDRRVKAEIVQPFIKNYSIFDREKRIIMLQDLVRDPDKQVSDNLCFSIFEEWKNKRMEDDEIFKITSKSNVPQLRHKIAYSLMYEIKNEEAQRVLENTILTDLIIENNYIYGPVCITIGNLYSKDPNSFDKIINLLRTEEIDYIQSRIKLYIDKAVEDYKKSASMKNKPIDPDELVDSRSFPKMIRDISSSILSKR